MRKLIFIPLSIFIFQFSFANITPVWTCGFECGVSGSVGQHWDGSQTFSTTTVRSGARSIRFNPSASTLAASSLNNTISTQISVIRLYVLFTTLPAADYDIIRVAGGVRFKQSDSKLYAYGSTFGATGVSVTTGQWYKIDLKVNSSANTWLIDCKIDGADCGQASNAIGAPATQTQVVLGHGSNATADLFIDDLIISATSGDYPIGAGYVNHFIATSDGSHSGITSNDYERTLTGTDILNSTTDSYQLLDDVPLESGSSVDWINMVAPVASSYVENIFGPAPGISTPTTAPRFVSVIIGIHAAGTGVYNAEWLLNDNGSTSAIFTASAVAGVTSVIYKTLNLSDPPSAASSWTLSGNGNFNNLIVRFGATSSVDANPDVYFDCAMIEAEFEEVSLTIPGTPSDKRHTTLGVGQLAATKSRISNLIK